MAENTTLEPAEIAVTPALEKKPRAPRRSKAEIEAAALVKLASKEKIAKTAKAKQISKAIAVEAENKDVEAAEAPAKTPKTVSAEPATGATNDGLDDIATLIELEEENRRLRKLLAEKLRMENADLRKRLGQN